MRLLDRMLAEGFICLKPEVNIDQIRTEFLESAQLVLVDNVADYHFQTLQTKLRADQTMQVSDFPNVMLPFENTFLEMRIRDNPSFKATFKECGVLARMIKPEQLGITESNEILRPIFLNNDVAYAMICMFFFYHPDLRKVIFSATFTLPVSASGQIVQHDHWLPVMGIIYGMPEEEKFDFQLYLRETYLFPCFLALSFMHCRNVKVMTEYPPPKLSKKHERKSGRPLIKYRVLQIDHMKQILEREGKASIEGLKHALHICRGHFKRYGLEGRDLLFGKHVALVWRPMEVRGTAEKGVVDKDYDVK